MASKNEDKAGFMDLFMYSLYVAKNQTENIYKQVRFSYIFPFRFFFSQKSIIMYNVHNTHVGMYCTLCTGVQ